MSPHDQAAFTQLLYQRPAPRVARIVLNRPERRNAQGTTLLYELDRAFRTASHDDEVHVVILAAAGEHFSAGHDLSGSEPWMPDVAQTLGLWGQLGGPGWEGQYAREKEVYLELTERWRNAPKPTIAEVQGSVIAGGVMLVWACDLIICADDARFRDNTAGDMGVPGVEFFQHPFEMGVRKAKEWLFTSDWLTAAEAERRGMVNHVVARADLPAFTLDLAERIAEKNRFTLKLVKEQINHAQDVMGRKLAMDYAFALHQIGHLQNMLVHNYLIDVTRLPPALRARLEAQKAVGGSAPGPTA
ncbi:enoyl-CoA hydratase [Phenylobacterium sp.]|uniref:enoyl-CoA hydratase n=1 Tax=Phenylobacterium sp. TaxID=1871053 RepID=UPI00301D8BD8